MEDCYITKLINLTPVEIQAKLLKCLNIQKTPFLVSKKRNFFFKFLRENLLPYYYDIIKYLNSLEKTGLQLIDKKTKKIQKIKIRYVIRGSSSWYMDMMKDYINTPLSTQEILDTIMTICNKNPHLAASFTPQNWDISIFCNESDLPDVLHHVKNHFRSIATQIQQEQKIQTSVIAEEKYLDRLDIFSGVFVAICLSNNNFKQYKMFAEPDCNKLSDSSLFMVYATLHPVDNLANFNKKLFKHIVIKYKKASIYNSNKYTEPANFLNLHGRLLYVTTMDVDNVNRIQTKGIDIDTMRKQYIIDKEGVMNIALIFNQLICYWTDTFSPQLNPKMYPEQKDKNNIVKTYKYDSLFEDEFQYSTILSGLQNKVLSYSFSDKNNTSDLDKIDQVVITYFRPIINSIIIQLSEELAVYEKKYKEIQEIAVFIVGGDAFTRYIKSASTSDIDIKIIVTPVVKTQEKWFSLHIWKEIRKKIINTVSKYIVYLNYILKFTHNTTSQNLSPLFRLRSHDGIQSSKFYLFSIDVRTKHNVNVKCKEQFLTYKQYVHDLAILDISVSFDGMKHYKSNKITYMNTSPSTNLLDNYIHLPLTKFYNKKLPVASVDFLIEEIEHRYSDPVDLSNRFSAGLQKIQKDIIRYTDLSSIKRTKQQIDIITTNNIIDLYILFTLTGKTINPATKQPTPLLKLSNLASIYTSLFLHQIISRMNIAVDNRLTSKKKTTTKHPHKLLSNEQLEIQYNINDEFTFYNFKLPYNIFSSVYCNKFEKLRSICIALNKSKPYQPLPPTDNKPGLPIINCSDTTFKQLLNKLYGSNFSYKCVPFLPNLFNSSI